MIPGKTTSSEFTRNVATLITGSAVAQLIPLLVTPLLSRMYSPESFGDFGLFISIVSAISIIATARYEMAVMLPHKDEEAFHLVILAFIVSAAVGVITFLVVLVLRNAVNVNFQSHPMTGMWLYVLPVIVVLAGVFQTFSNWFNRKKNYRILAAGTMISSAGTNSTSLLFGIFKMSSWGLFAANIIGQVVLNFYLFSKFAREWKNFFPKFSKTLMKELALRYKIFPTVNVLYSLVGMLQINGLIYLVSYFFSTEELGHLSFSMRLLQAPVSLVGAAFSQVFYQKASSLHREQASLQHLVKETILKATLIGLPVVIVLIFAGPYLFSVIFGEGWRESGVYVSILAPWFFFDFIRIPVSNIPMILEKQKSMFVFTFLGNIILLAAMIYAGTVAHNIRSGLYTLSLCLSAYYILIILWIYNISRKHEQA